MIAPHHEDDEDAVVNLPLLVEIVAGNTPQIGPKPDETETTIILPTIGLGNTETTEKSTTKNTIEPSTMSTSTTKRPFLLPISG